MKFVYCVDIGFHTGCHDVGICTETIVNVTVVFHLHVNLPYIVGALVYCLYGKLFQGHLSVYDFLESRYGCVNGTIARSCLLEFLAGYVEPYARNATHAHAARHLQVIEPYMVVFGAVCAYENEDVVVGDFFLAVGKAEESLVNLIEFFS